MAPFPRSKFEPKQFTIQSVPGVPGVLSTDIEHAAIVAGEDHQRVVGDFLLVKRVHHFADNPVQFVNKVAVRTAAAGALKARRWREGMMDVCCRQIQEERILSASLNPVDRLAGQSCADGFIVVQRVGSSSSANLIDPIFSGKTLVCDF